MVLCCCGGMPGTHLIPSARCSLWGSSPRPMAHKTIALTTELREHWLCDRLRSLINSSAAWKCGQSAKMLAEEGTDPDARRVVRRHTENSRPRANGCGDAMDGRSSRKGIWRNGSASDSRSEGWEFESLCPHMLCAGRLRQRAGFFRVWNIRCSIHKDEWTSSELRHILNCVHPVNRAHPLNRRPLPTLHDAPCAWHVVPRR